jgi:hypothetical protein
MKNVTETIEAADLLLRGSTDGDLTELEQFCREAVTAYPGDSDLHYLLAVSIIVADREAGLAELEEAVRLAPSGQRASVAIKSSRQVLLHCGAAELERAKRFIKVASDIGFDRAAPFAADAMNVIGNIAALEGVDHELAEDSLHDAFKQEPDNFLFVRDLANYLAHMGRGREAMAVLDEAIPIVPPRGAAILGDLRSRMESHFELSS